MRHIRADVRARAGFAGSSGRGGASKDASKDRKRRVDLREVRGELSS